MGGGVWQFCTKGRVVCGGVFTFCLGCWCWKFDSAPLWFRCCSCCLSVRSGHFIVLSVSFSGSLSVAPSVWELGILMYGHASILHPGPPKAFPFSACTSYVCQQHPSVLQTAPPAASDSWPGSWPSGNCGCGIVFLFLLLLKVFFLNSPSCRSWNSSSWSSWNSPSCSSSNFSSRSSWNSPSCSSSNSSSWRLVKTNSS